MNSIFMRIISIFGIILLLTLQYFWVQNAYEMVEGNLMEKSKECLREAIDKEVIIRTGATKSDFADGGTAEELYPTGIILASVEIESAADFRVGCQDICEITGDTCSIIRVDSIFKKVIFERTGFIPKHHIKIIEDSTRLKITKQFQKAKGRKNWFSENFVNINDTLDLKDNIIGNTLFVKLTSKKSIQLDFTSPIISVITKARYIFIISILLVLLLGIILIFQYKSMLKDKEFGVFLKDFSRVLAHELRTPINDIYLLISTVLSKDFNDDQKIEQYQEESLNQCSKMLVTIDNILLIAKSEISKIHILKSQIDMRPFIEGIVDKYRDHYFMGKTLNIETECLTEDCTSFFDPELMENVLINLIENAIKYSYEKVNIHIIFSVENNHLLLRVKDDGFGISKSNMKNIFKIFGRGSKMDYRQIKGFGIGLFYVQKVIKAHNGTIEVTSEEGKGSEFIMDIPIKFS